MARVFFRCCPASYLWDFETLLLDDILHPQVHEPREIRLLARLRSDRSVGGDFHNDDDGHVRAGRVVDLAGFAEGNARGQVFEDAGGVLADGVKRMGLHAIG